MKEILGIIAVVLTFVGYIPYIIDSLKGKTTPHVYTWFIWGLVTAIAYGLQVSDGAGMGSLVTLAAASVCFVIFFIGLRSGNKDIAFVDKICLLLGLGALALWLLAEQPVLSVLIVSAADLIAFIPTIRKSWSKPYQETLFSYEMNAFRFALALIALEKYTIVSSLYPWTWLVANTLFSVYLIVRRQQVPTPSS